MEFKKALQHTILWKVLYTITTFLINIFLVRLLGAEQSGSFFYTITLLSLLILFQSWSLEAGIVYYGSKNASSVSGISILILPWLILQLLISVIILNWLPMKAISKPMAILYIISNLTILYITALYAVQKKFVTPNRILVTVNFILLIIFGCMFFFKTSFTFFNTGNELHSAALFYLYSFPVQALLLITFFIFGNKGNTIVFNIDKSLLKNILTFSSIAFASNVLFFLVTRVDYYFVQKYCSLIALSNYIQVSKLGQLLVMFPSVIAGVIFPYTAAATSSESYVSKTQFFCRVITGCIIVFAILIAASGYWLFPWLFGTEFRLMYTSLLIYLPGFFSLCIVTILASYSGGLGMIKTNLAATIIALLLVIVADIIFIPRWGINGAAAASSIAYFICMVYLLVQIMKKMPGAISDYFVVTNADIKMVTNYFKKK
jgi:O-antigen/teichoic acid export membrane protein